MLRSFVVVVLVASALVVAPSGVAAQGQDPPLSELLPQLYARVIFAERDAFVEFLPGIININELNDAALSRFREETFPIIRLAGNQLSSFPLAAASGGFTWTFDTASGAAMRTSNSFGPIFGERPLTIGRNRLNVGANFQRVTFDHLEERSLRGGDIVSYLSVPFFFDYFYFENALDLKLTTETLNVFATYGVTDRMDVGVAIPINRVDVEAKLTARFGLASSGLDEEFVPVDFSESGTASGVGDVVIRAKFNIFTGETWGVAESVDVRLPTGDELNLLGIAGPQVKLTFIAASALGQLSPHANLAYTISGASPSATDPNTYVFEPREEINYAAGADLALSPRATVAADVVGRVMRRAGTMTWGPAFEEAQFTQYQQFDFTDRRDLHLLLGSVGLKVNPFKTMLFTANVLFPLTKNGLTDRLTWMAGVDYSF
jgi:hypothetical protein